MESGRVRIEIKLLPENFKGVFDDKRGFREALENAERVGYTFGTAGESAAHGVIGDGWFRRDSFEVLP